MGVPARNAVYACDVTDLGERLVLLVLADFSQSEHSPFEAWPGVARIAQCVNRSQEQTRRYLRRLKNRGVIEPYQINRYQWGYRIMLPDAGLSADDQPDIPDVSPDDTPQFSGLPTYDQPDTPGVSHHDTPHYPYGVSSGSRDLSSGSRDLSSGSRDLSSGSLLIRKERIERIEREENEGDARTRDPAPPMSTVMTADQAVQTLLAYLEGEVSDHERRTWRERIRAGWSGPDVLCLRGPASLVRLPRFTGCMRMAAKQLEMGAVIEFSVIGG